MSLLILLSAMTGADSPELSTYINKYLSTFKQEKVYLHVAGSQFEPGNRIWFKAYLFDATNRVASAGNSVIHVDLIDPNQKVAARRTLKAVDGKANGDFMVEEQLPHGVYTLRAYTNWMRNFSSRLFYYHPILVTPSDINLIPTNHKMKLDQLLFFPEGGAMIEGLRNTIAVSATDEFGQGLMISGEVADSDGKVVGRVQTSERGYGRFKMTPEPNKNYFARVQINGKEMVFKIEGPKPSGIQLNVRNFYKSDYVIVTARAKGTSLANSTLILQQHGNILYQHNNTEDKPFQIKILRSEIPTGGLCHLTLFNSYNDPIAERLFIANLPTNEYEIQRDFKCYYGKNEWAELIIDLQSELPGGSDPELSVSVVASQAHDKDFEQMMENYISLDSNLEGYIRNSAYYFQNSPDSFEELDNLLLTKRWGRFDWSEVLVDSLHSARYSHQIGTTLSGQLVDFDDRSKPRAGTLTLSSFIDVFHPIEVETDETGYFSINGLQYHDITDLIIKASRKTGKHGKMKDDVYIKLNSESSIPVDQEAYNEKIMPFANHYRRHNYSINAGESSMLLDEVEVTTNPLIGPNSDYKKTTIPVNRVIADSLNNRFGITTVFDYLRKIPGVMVAGLPGSEFARLRGATVSVPMYVVDGVQSNEGFVASMNPLDVDYIDVLKGGESAIFGINGTNGVIAIYTKKKEGREGIQKPGMAIVRYPGFHIPQKFEDRPDHLSGSTLHWNPSIRVSEDGTAKIRFYTGDVSGPYDVLIQGTYSNGTPISLKRSLRIE